MSSTKGDAPTKKSKQEAKVRSKRTLLEIRFKGVQPNIIVFYAFRSVVNKYFWEVNVHGREVDDFGAFDVFINGECVFMRKDSYGYPSIAQLLRELNTAEMRKEAAEKSQSGAAAGAGPAEANVATLRPRETEWKLMDLSKLDVKSWLVKGKGLV